MFAVCRILQWASKRCVASVECLDKRVHTVCTNSRLPRILHITWTLHQPSDSSRITAHMVVARCTENNVQIWQLNINILKPKTWLPLILWPVETISIDAWRKTHFKNNNDICTLTKHQLLRIIQWRGPLNFCNNSAIEPDVKFDQSNVGRRHLPLQWHPRAQVWCWQTNREWRSLF